MNDFINFIEKNRIHNFKFDLQTKRMDGPDGRDWYGRWCWKRERYAYEPDHGTYSEIEACEWEGFDTLKECFDDFMNLNKGSVGITI